MPKVGEEDGERGDNCLDEELTTDMLRVVRMLVYIDNKIDNYDPTKLIQAPDSEVEDAWTRFLTDKPPLLGEPSRSSPSPPPPLVLAAASSSSRSCFAIFSMLSSASAKTSVRRRCSVVVES